MYSPAPGNRRSAWCWYSIRARWWRICNRSGARDGGAGGRTRGSRARNSAARVDVARALGEYRRGHQRPVTLRQYRWRRRGCSGRSPGARWRVPVVSLEALMGGPGFRAVPGVESRDSLSAARAARLGVSRHPDASPSRDRRRSIQRTPSPQPAPSCRTAVHRRRPQAGGPAALVIPDLESAQEGVPLRRAGFQPGD